MIWFMFLKEEFDLFYNLNFKLAACFHTNWYKALWEKFTQVHLIIQIEVNSADVKTFDIK